MTYKKLIDCRDAQILRRDELNAVKKSHEIMKDEVYILRKFCEQTQTLTNSEI